MSDNVIIFLDPRINTRVIDLLPDIKENELIKISPIYVRNQNGEPFPIHTDQIKRPGYYYFSDKTSPAKKVFIMFLSDHKNIAYLNVKEMNPFDVNQVPLQRISDNKQKQVVLNISLIKPDTVIEIKPKERVTLEHVFNQLFLPKEVTNIRLGDFSKKHGSWYHKKNKLACSTEKYIPEDELRSLPQQDKSKSLLTDVFYLGGSHKGDELCLIQFKRYDTIHTKSILFKNLGPQKEVSKNKSFKSRNILLQAKATEYIVPNNRHYRLDKIIEQKTLQTFDDKKEYKIYLECLGDEVNRNGSVQYLKGEELKKLKFFVGKHTTSTVLSILMGDQTKTFAFTSSKTITEQTIRSKKLDVTFTSTNNVTIHELCPDVRSVRDIYSEDNLSIQKENGRVLEYRKIHEIYNPTKCHVLTQGSGVSVLQTRDKNNLVSNHIILSRIAP